MMLVPAIYGEYDGCFVECCGDVVSIYKEKNVEYIFFDAMDLPVSNTEELIAYCLEKKTLPAVLIINTLKRCM